MADPPPFVFKYPFTSWFWKYFRNHTADFLWKMEVKNNAFVYVYLRFTCFCPMIIYSESCDKNVCLLLPSWWLLNYILYPSNCYLTLWYCYDNIFFKQLYHLFSNVFLISSVVHYKCNMFVSMCPLRCILSQHCWCRWPSALVSGCQ